MPPQEKPERQPPPKSPLVATGLSPCTILIADKDIRVCNELATMLAELGHKVVGVAADCELAVHLACDCKPDLALLDISVPEFGGIAMAKELFGELGIPSILISTNSCEEHVKSILSYGESAGVFGYLHKPISRWQLAEAVGLAMQRAARDGHRASRVEQLEGDLKNRRIAERAECLSENKQKGDAIAKPVLADKQMSDTAAEKPQSRGESVSTTFIPARILVADDEYLVATGLANSAADLGHKVVGIAPDGEIAVQMAREHKPDLALLAIRMPKLSGIDAALLLYSELGTPSIIISAYSDEEYVKKIHSHGDAAGVFGYLLKPVSSEQLAVTIGAALRRAAVDEQRVTLVGQPGTNPQNLRTVERAKWILVEKRKITEPEAHKILQDLSRDRHRAAGAPSSLAQEILLRLARDRRSRDD